MEQELQKLSELAKYFLGRGGVMNLGVSSVLSALSLTLILNDGKGLLMLTDAANEIVKYQTAMVAEMLRDKLPIKSSQP